MNFWERDNPDNGKNNNSSNSNQNNSGWNGNGANRSDQNSNSWNSNGTKRSADQSASGWNGNGANRNGQSGNNSKEDFERLATDSFNKYSNMDETQLMSELLKTAGGMRQNGTLKPEDLESFYKNASGFLTAEQMAKLRTLINMLKNI